MHVIRVGRFITLAAVAVALGGCVSLTPEQRAEVVRPQMVADPYPLDTRFDDTLYHSKEAATGSRHLQPGVCGCK